MNYSSFCVYIFYYVVGNYYFFYFHVIFFLVLVHDMSYTSPAVSSLLLYYTIYIILPFLLHIPPSESMLSQSFPVRAVVPPGLAIVHLLTYKKHAKNKLFSYLWRGTWESKGGKIISPPKVQTFSFPHWWLCPFLTSDITRVYFHPFTDFKFFIFF